MGAPCSQAQKRMGPHFYWASLDRPHRAEPSLWHALVFFM